MVKRQFIHKANKNRDQNFGSKEIDLIAQTLTKLGFQCIIEPKINNPKFQTTNKIRNPDLEVRFSDMKLLVESDGRVHGTLEFPSKSTIRRNQDFLSIKIPMIMINYESIKELKKILKISITDEEITKFLVSYMVLEKYCWHISKQ